MCFERLLRLYEFLVKESLGGSKLKSEACQRVVRVIVFDA
jgi:hypothetical protein